MSARTGAEYLAGLREQPLEIWLDGKRINDVTEFPGLANGARSSLRYTTCRTAPTQVAT
jgi:aromatic ring hydroxylase